MTVFILSKSEIGENDITLGVYSTRDKAKQGAVDKGWYVEWDGMTSEKEPHKEYGIPKEQKHPNSGFAIIEWEVK